MNKKLQEIKQSEININYNINDNFHVFKINISSVIQPGARPRVNSYGVIYDPLASYKNYIKKEIKKYIDKFDFQPNENEVIVECNIYMRPPKTMTNNKKIMAIRGRFQPKIKPDNDNFEKTIFDLFKNILWLDDNQIISNITNKYYSVENKTEITIKIYKENRIEKYEGRLKENITEEEKQFLESYKK